MVWLGVRAPNRQVVPCGVSQVECGRSTSFLFEKDLGRGFLSASEEE